MPGPVLNTGHRTGSKIQSSLVPLEEAWAWQHLDPGFLASRTVRHAFLLFKPPICGALAWQP